MKKTKMKIMSLLLSMVSVSYTHLRAHETDSYLVCRLLLEKKKNQKTKPDADSSRLVYIVDY